MRFVLFLCLLLAPVVARAQAVTVFAAASLTDAMKDIAAEWTKAGHKPLRLSFGAGHAQQIAVPQLKAEVVQQLPDIQLGLNVAHQGARLCALPDHHTRLVVCPKTRAVVAIGELEFGLAMASISCCWNLTATRSGTTGACVSSTICSALMPWVSSRPQVPCPGLAYKGGSFRPCSTPAWLACICSCQPAGW